MKKSEQIILIDLAIKRLTAMSRTMETETSNPTVMRQFDIIQGKLAGYDACRWLLKGSAVSINVDAKY